MIFSSFQLFKAHARRLFLFFISAGTLTGCGLDDNRETTEVSPSATGIESETPQKVFIQIVNDSGKPDRETYLLFDTPTKDPRPVVDGVELLEDSGHSTGEGQALASLASTGTITSAYTGEIRKIYTFGISTVDSGRLTFSFGKPVVIKNGAAPTVDTPIRYDKMEVTFKKDPKSGVMTGGGNLTAIDFHAIPLQVEVTHEGQNEPDPLQTKSFYASMPTLIKALEAMGGRDRLAPAIRTLDGAEFSAVDKQSFNYANFARILTPNVLAEPDNPIATDLKSRNKPLPYPGFGSYLKSLVGKKYLFNGQQHGGYSYTCVFGEAVPRAGADGFSGYKANCSGTGIVEREQIAVNNAPKVPINANVVLKFPVETLDFIIYASVANETSYSIEGYPFTVPVDASYKLDDLIATANQSAYGSLKGDVHAALNFGYLGGRYDTHSASDGVLDVSSFFASAMVPYAYPFGGARPEAKDDGFYNPWGALMNNVSDAYSHPFSDRIRAASPLYNLRAGDTVRITILNDLRLDTPLPSVLKSATKDNQLTVIWPSVANATSYSITSVPAVAASGCATVVPVAADTQSCELKGLSPGSSYRINVVAKANKTTADKPITSGSVSIQGVTSGTLPALKSGELNVGMNINLPESPKIPGITAYINGSLVRTGENAQNVFLKLAPDVPYTIPLQIKSSASNIIYSGNYFLTLKASDKDSFEISRGYLDFGLAAISPAPEKKTYRNTGELVIGSIFLVKPYYQYFDPKFSE